MMVSAISLVEMASVVMSNSDGATIALKKTGAELL